MKWLAAILVVLAAGGCAHPTSFEGKAHFPGGAKACQVKCEGQGLEMAALVYSGEFASSCVCRQRGSATPPTNEVAGAAADATAAGVFTQMRAAQQRRSQGMQHSQQQHWQQPRSAPFRPPGAYP